jgi:dTMP kinase
VELLIRPALIEGRVIVSDRYADATAAYQGAGRGFPQETVDQIIRIATGGLKPDLTLFFDISVETAISRMGSPTEEDRVANRMDFETADFYSRVRRAYLSTAEREPERFCVIDAEGPVEEIHAAVSRQVNELLGSA